MPLFKRYEVLLPVRYNDGTPIEEEKFQRTWLEARQQFGGLTIDLHPLRGIWVHEEIVYEDELIRLVLDVEDTPENRDWFSPMEGNAEGTVFGSWKFGWSPSPLKSCNSLLAENLLHLK
jgi:hypothetical protein